jgi:ATP-dependent protease ClpP protease subunit
MRLSQVCKHQVCDYCGGRFGMVTHRWWGDKFCKKTCKNAYLRENHHTLSAWVIPQFLSAGGACLVAAVAVVVLTLLLASANAAPGEERPVAGASLEFNKEDGTLYIDWSGPIVAGMADDLRAALGKYETTLNRVVLFLDSAGGQVEEGDRVIEALNEIKLRRQLVTVVPHGKLCASMCIPIFLQGEDRLAARASVWIFHEVAQRQANGTIRRKRRKQICSTYYRRATSRLYPNKRRKKADIS